MTYDRRQFLRMCSVAGTAVAGGVFAAGGTACTSDTAGDGAADATTSGSDAAPRTDGSPACPATTPDVQGPFFEPGAPMRAKIADDTEPGERLRIHGVITADDCTTPVAGALLDVWQADKDGNYHDAATEFRLRGQVLTDAQGRFELWTIRPGNYPLTASLWRPAHIHFTITKPGYAPLTTQLYFEGDPFLPPNDGCTTCGSNDPNRIIALADDGASGHVGEFRVVLGRA